MPTVIDQLETILGFCRARSIVPQAVEVCRCLGSHVRVAPEVFSQLELSDAAHTVFGGDNPWLLRVGYIDGIEIRTHDAVETELAKSALGDRPYITARTFGSPAEHPQFNLTASVDLPAKALEVHHA
jgi:hypothetical protein